MGDNYFCWCFNGQEEFGGRKGMGEEGRRVVFVLLEVVEVVAKPLIGPSIIQQ